MATYAQTPGLLNIKAVTGTDFSCQLDFGTNLSAYTFDSAIVLQEYPTKREQAITVTVDSAAQGIITLSLTDTQTSALGTFSKKKWYLNWNISGIKQTILAGNFELSDIPLGQNEVTSTGVTINTQSVDITLSAFSNAALDGKLDKSSVSAFGLTLIDDIDASTARTTLELGNLSLQNSGSVTLTGGTVTGITDLALADGGTNASLTPAAGAIVYSTASAMAIGPVGESGQVLTSGGSGAPVWVNQSSLTQTATSNVNVTDNDSTNAPYYPIFVPATGNNQPVTASSTKLRYNPFSGNLAATSFTGDITGNVTGNVVGNVTGNVTGNITGSASTTVINNNNTANREFFPVFAYQSAGAATTLYGSSTKLKFNPSNGYFTADVFSAGSGSESQLRYNGLFWNNSIALDIEQGFLYDPNANQIARWASGLGEMYVVGTSSKDFPLRLMDGDATNLSTGSYIIVRPSASATTNGTELRNAYAAAKTFTPNSLALSATNRATVLLLPGRYDLGTTPLAMDTEFVDLVGLSDDPRHVFITSQVILSDSGTIVQTADNVIIRNVSIDRTGTPAGAGAGRTAAYFPNRTSTAIQAWTSDGTTATITSNGHGLLTGDSVRITGSGNSSLDGAYTVTRIDDNSFTFLSTVSSSGSIGTATERFDDTYIENCRFSGDSDSGMRRSVEYAGTYRRCVGGAGSFGTDGSNSSGLFEDCTATSGSFGGGIVSQSAIASGTFRRCTASSLSFGIQDSSGLFEDCIATTQSFGGRTGGPSNATGTFRRCRGTSDCFGFFAITGIFENCTVTAGNGFGSGNGISTCSGTLTECSINTSSSFTGTFTGTMRRCRFVTTGTNANALRVGAGAKIFDSTLIATGTGNSITAGSAVTISLAGCRMNRDINANVSNNLGTLTESYNLIDADID